MGSIGHKLPPGALRLLQAVYQIVEFPGNLGEFIVAGEDGPEFVSDIGQEAERLSRITEDLLRLTRLDSGIAETAKLVEVAPVLERAARMLRPVAARAVALSMFSFCKMESVSRRMAASGVFSSWEASDTNCRRALTIPVRWAVP